MRLSELRKNLTSSANEEKITHVVTLIKGKNLQVAFRGDLASENKETTNNNIFMEGNSYMQVE